MGAQARRMLGRTPATITATRPLRDCVIRELGVTQEILRHFIRQALDGRRARPRVMVCVPSGPTKLERRAVLEAAHEADARQALLIEEPMAAAMDTGLDVSEPMGHLIVDVGGGTTEVAVIALGGIVSSRSIRVGGDTLDEALIAYVRREHNFVIGLQTAEDLKFRIGSAHRPRCAGATSPAAWRTPRCWTRRRCGRCWSRPSRRWWRRSSRPSRRRRPSWRRTSCRKASCRRPRRPPAGPGRAVAARDRPGGARRGLPLTCVAVGAGLALAPTPSARRRPTITVPG